MLGGISLRDECRASWCEGADKREQMMTPEMTSVVMFVFQISLLRRSRGLLSKIPYYGVQPKSRLLSSQYF
jgi:hypothetical protein